MINSEIYFLQTDPTESTWVTGISQTIVLTQRGRPWSLNENSLELTDTAFVLQSDLSMKFSCSSLLLYWHSFFQQLSSPIAETSGNNAIEKAHINQIYQSNKIKILTAKEKKTNCQKKLYKIKISSN